MKKQRKLSNKRNNDLIAHPYLWRYIDRFLNEKRWKQVSKSTLGRYTTPSPTYLKRLEVWGYALGFSREEIVCKFVNLGDEDVKS